MNPVRHIAVVSPRFAEGGTVGGAETLLGNLARRAAARGLEVSFLTTCATSHFTWKNERPAGEREIDGLRVHFFPVDGNRDESLFLRVQQRISRNDPVSRAEEEAWLAHSVNSAALIDHLRSNLDRYDRVLAGPYLFGLVWNAMMTAASKALLVPCLHDEPFAYVSVMRDLFESVRGCLFNAGPEQALARRLFGAAADRGRVVGMGIDPLEVDPDAFAARAGLAAPYVMYSGRRETLKGTPLLCAYLHAFRERTGTDLKLVCTGSGPIEAPDDLRPHIVDLGFVDERAKREAMAGARAFIHPSALESFGIVLLESFLCGTPALVNAGSEVLTWQCAQGGAGLWFRNYPEFEEELRLLLTDEILRRRLGANGRDYVRRTYSWEAVEDRFLSALNEL